MGHSTQGAFGSTGLPTDGGMGGRKRLGLVIALGGAFVLLAAAAALADNYQYRFASADQAAARSAVLLRSDLPMLMRIADLPARYRRHFAA